MYTNSILALSGLLSLVAAAPVNKRDVVWITHTQEDVVTVPVTTTIWVDPTNGANNNWHPRPTSTLTVQSTYTVPAAQSSPVGSSSAAAPSTYAAPASTSTTSAYVAPTTSSSVYTAPTTPSTTSTWVAPTTSSAPAPSTYASASSTAPQSSASGTSPSGSTYSGDITYYTPGMGSCGQTNSDSDSIVALAHGMMTAALGNNPNPNANPLCGKSITISYGGKTHEATITDTCGGCDGASIDLTPSLFDYFASESEGRVHGVQWWYN